MNASPIRMMTGALILGLSLLIPASAAVADTDLGHTGLVGKHHLADKDTAAGPGANCFYDETDPGTGAATIRVWPPRVWARDRTSGEDTQAVGYLVKLEQSNDGGATWHTTFTSSIIKRSATDATRANFPSHEYAVPENAKVRAVVKTFWYAPGSTTTVQGTALNRVDWYGRSFHVFLDVVGGSCGKMSGTR